MIAADYWPGWASRWHPVHCVMLLLLLQLPTKKDF